MTKKQLKKQRAYRAGYSTGATGNLYSAATGGFTIPKSNVLVLCANRRSFDMFLALGPSTEEKKNNEYIFIDSLADLEVGGAGALKILNDFCLNPRIEELLDALNERTYVTSRLGTSGTFSVSGCSGWTPIKATNFSIGGITIKTDFK